jgi:hypothetical protein
VQRSAVKQQIALVLLAWLRLVLRKPRSERPQDIFGAGERASPSEFIRYFDLFNEGATMKRSFGWRSFYLRIAGVLMMLLFTGTLARAQSFYQIAWGGNYNMSVGNETEDNWVANSFRARSGTHLTAIYFPIAAAFTDQPVQAFIYQGFDLQDPTVGLTVLGQTNTTFTAIVGDIVTIQLNPPVDVNTGDIFYAAVMIPGVPSGSNGKFPWYVGTQVSSQSPQMTPLGRSFFDVGSGALGSGQGGTFDISTQDVTHVTPFGQAHPVLGGGPTDVVDPGNLALFVKGTLPP